jgi:hypothetical protein
LLLTLPSLCTFVSRWFDVVFEGTFVIQAGSVYQLLGRNSLNEMALASPAVAGGSLFIRTATKLYRMSKPDL